MKKIIYSIAVTLLMSLFSVGANAQVFSKMPEKKRNATLIKLAKEMYKYPIVKEFRKKMAIKALQALEALNTSLSNTKNVI